MSDEELWRRVRSRLTARPHEPAQIGPEVESLPDRVVTVRVARFVIDVCGASPARIANYLHRLEQTTKDKAFARAVRREVKRILAKENAP